MKESVGYSVTLNIVIVFIIVIFSFLSFALIYYKANKVTNVVVNSIEKYEGYNTLAENEILNRIISLGYNTKSIKCKEKIGGCELIKNGELKASNGEKGYCVYYCDNNDYYYYRIRTNMFLNIPLIHDVIDLPIYTNTNELYDFEKLLQKEINE